ncbi:MAG: hypothetical protein E6G89_16890 [Alphaproteobacteria bacterium]|nr:MAG: hypothetical protein E6G89_16890 [Alphaproteobacteria bacterium]
MLDRAKLNHGAAAWGESAGDLAPSSRLAGGLYAFSLAIEGYLMKNTGNRDRAPDTSVIWNIDFRIRRIENIAAKMRIESIEIIGCVFRHSAGNA